jgi:excisionase family DNA binding protein
MNSQILMKVPEFAGALTVTSACVRRWILERRVVSVKVGRLVRIPASEVERIIAAGLRPARGAKPAGKP